MNRRQFITSTLVASTSLLAVPAVRAQESGHLNAADEWLYDTCGEMWPNQGAIETQVSDNGVYKVGYYCTFTRSELAALKCVAPRFEFRFVIGGFLNADDAQGSSRFSSNLPGGRKRSIAYDVDNDVTLRYGFVRTGNLSAGEYNIHLEFWGLKTDRLNNPWVAIQLGMVSEDEGTIPLFLSRGKLGDVIYFNGGDNHGYQWLPFGR